MKKPPNFSKMVLAVFEGHNALNKSQISDLVVAKHEGDTIRHQDLLKALKDLEKEGFLWKGVNENRWYRVRL